MMTIFSQRLAEIMKEKKLSFRELEKLSGISRGSILRFRKGTTEKVSIEKVKSLAKALGVDPEYLIGWTDEKLSVQDEELRRVIDSFFSLDEEKRKIVLSVIQGFRKD